MLRQEQLQPYLSTVGQTSSLVQLSYEEIGSSDTSHHLLVFHPSLGCRRLFRLGRDFIQPRAVDKNAILYGSRERDQQCKATQQKEPYLQGEKRDAGISRTAEHDNI